ncbi:MAG: MBL fold metallo-hydrolase [Gammaproteobacteria bacterium]|nr:MBL fold metallo-hydrolase [Gammaproteobacteria bacterium]
MASATRRQLIQGALAAGIALPAARWRLAHAQNGVTTTELAADLHILTAGGINAVAQTRSGRALLVDGGSAMTSAALLDTAAALAGSGPIDTLFNTHWHPEQTGSNVTLGEAGATIIAQENTRLWLATDIVYPWDETQRFDPLPKAGQPNRSFYDEGELDDGTRYGYLRHAAHTDGDLYVYFPEANVLAVGDAVSGAGWPFVDWWTGGWIGGIVGTLEYVHSLMDDATRLVPARGPVLSRVDVAGQFEMYNTIYDRLGSMLNNGFSPDEAVEAKPTAEWDAEMGQPDEFVRRAFESLWAYLSPDA